MVVDAGDTGYSLDHIFNVHWRLFLRVLSSGKNFNCLIFFNIEREHPERFKKNSFQVTFEEQVFSSTIYSAGAF